MIEGLRVLPRYQATRRTDPDVIESLDCNTCKRDRSVHEREQRRCGYLALPPLPDDPAARSRATRGVPFSDRIEGLETCPGFTVHLADVADIAGAYRHWVKGALSLYLGGQDPTAALMLGLQVFEAAIEQHEADAAREAVEKQRRPQPWA